MQPDRRCFGVILAAALVFGTIAPPQNRFEPRTVEEETHILKRIAITLLITLSFISLYSVLPNTRPIVAARNRLPRTAAQRVSQVRTRAPRESPSRSSI